METLSFLQYLKYNLHTESWGLILFRHEMTWQGGKSQKDVFSIKLIAKHTLRTVETIESVKFCSHIL